MAAGTIWTGLIVDAHQHFWDPQSNPHPWLHAEAKIPLGYGDYSAITRRYLPDDYRANATGYGVCETVYVETEWTRRDRSTRPAGATSRRTLRAAECCRCPGLGSIAATRV